MKLKLLDTIDVATGGDPVAALTRAAARLPKGVYHLAVAHDPGCPCLADSPLRSCSCEILTLTLRGRA